MLPKVSAAEAEVIASATPTAAAIAAIYDWRRNWARPNQLPPDGSGWIVWLLLAGRGFGKTRVGAELVRERKETTGRIALVGPTAADVRDVMVEGESWEKVSDGPKQRVVEVRGVRGPFKLR